MDTTRPFVQALAQARNRRQRCRLHAQWLAALARDEVPDRPNRREVRALKRRPKSYPYLNRPRQRFQEIPHRSRDRAQMKGGR
jgi:hypothetical protein